MKCVACALLLAACASDPDSFPIQPGGGSAATGGLEQPEPTMTVLRGRVCVVDDIIARNCAITGAGNLTVTLGDQSVVTADNGTFTMVPGFGSNLSFTVSGANIVTTSQALTPQLVVPVLRQQAFDNLLTANGITTLAGTGSIFATLVRGGQPVSGATATSTPSPAFGPFFDTTQPAPWSLNATGASGIVFFPGVVAGPADLTFNTLTGGSAIVGGVQVINGGITMVETILP
jgi:hypothetical protein